MSGNVDLRNTVSSRRHPRLLSRWSRARVVNRDRLRRVRSSLSTSAGNPVSTVATSPQPAAIVETPAAVAAELRIASARTAAEARGSGGAQSTAGPGVGRDHGGGRGSCGGRGRRTAARQRRSGRRLGAAWWRRADFDGHDHADNYFPGLGRPTDAIPRWTRPDRRSYDRQLPVNIFDRDLFLFRTSKMTGSEYDLTPFNIRSNQEKRGRRPCRARSIDANVAMFQQNTFRWGCSEHAGASGRRGAVERSTKRGGNEGPDIGIPGSNDSRRIQNSKCATSLSLALDDIRTVISM